MPGQHRRSARTPGTKPRRRCARCRFSWSWTAARTRPRPSPRAFRGVRPVVIRRGPRRHRQARRGDGGHRQAPGRPANCGSPTPTPTALCRATGSPSWSPSPACTRRWCWGRSCPAPDSRRPLKKAWLSRHHLRDGHPHVHGANFGIRADTYLSLGGWPAADLARTSTWPGAPPAPAICGSPDRVDSRGHQRPHRRAGRPAASPATCRAGSAQARAPRSSARARSTRSTRPGPRRTPGATWPGWPAAART